MHSSISSTIIRVVGILQKGAHTSSKSRCTQPFPLLSLNSCFIFLCSNIQRPIYFEPYVRIRVWVDHRLWFDEMFVTRTILNMFLEIWHFIMKQDQFKFQKAKTYINFKKYIQRWSCFKDLIKTNIIAKHRPKIEHSVQNIWSFCVQTKKLNTRIYWWECKVWSAGWFC